MESPYLVLLAEVNRRVRPLLHHHDAAAGQWNPDRACHGHLHFHPLLDEYPAVAYPDRAAAGRAGKAGQDQLKWRS